MDIETVKKISRLCQELFVDVLKLEGLDDDSVDTIIEEWAANIPRVEADTFFENAFVNDLDFVENTLLAYTHPFEFAGKIKELCRIEFMAENTQAAFPHETVAHYLTVEEEVNQYLERLAEAI